MPGPRSRKESNDFFEEIKQRRDLRSNGTRPTCYSIVAFPGERRNKEEEI